jgi:hypothetical protein
MLVFIELTVQQSIRSEANDPQIQIAEDIARALADHRPVQELLLAGQVDIATSLAPYIILFDSSGNPTDSNARLHGEIPHLPAGVIEYTRQHGQDRISWQPEPGVRSATVLVHLLRIFGQETYMSQVSADSLVITRRILKAEMFRDGSRGDSE